MELWQEDTECKSGYSWRDLIFGQSRLTDTCYYFAATMYFSTAFSLSLRRCKKLGNPNEDKKIEKELEEKLLGCGTSQNAFFFLSPLPFFLCVTLTLRLRPTHFLTDYWYKTLLYTLYLLFCKRFAFITKRAATSTLASIRIKVEKNVLQ